MPRPRRDFQRVNLGLSSEDIAKIDSLVGKRARAEFIREAVFRYIPIAQQMKREGMPLKLRGVKKVDLQH